MSFTICIPCTCSWYFIQLPSVYVMSHCLKQAIPVDHVNLVSFILIRVGWHARRTTENLLSNYKTERFRASKCLDVFDVRHSEEVVVLSFVITNKLISLDPFFMMVMLNRCPFFLRLTVLRDNY